MCRRMSQPQLKTHSISTVVAKRQNISKDNRDAGTLTWDWQIIPSHMRKVRKSGTSLIPPHEAVLHILHIRGKVAVEFIMIVLWRSHDI
jgi:hypothetical protein